ncbi:Uncharacterized protein APZ42_021867 [Daphnia magna]|uniref:Uncharacterized protein n=1 Tax=Daphnia magna TaxID=35525 RepID=A0A164WA89_9CRUS|nr:Uncharacterized protein APZ42_021867 [Daphnia magna]
MQKKNVNNEQLKKSKPTGATDNGDRHPCSKSFLSVMVAFRNSLGEPIRRPEWPVRVCHQ